MLMNKKILFISPKFFGYENQIKNKLEDKGAIVDYYDERPSNHTLSKILIRLSPKLMFYFTHNYFNKIINENKEKDYDYVFFIKCEAILEKDLIRLRNNFATAKFILYLYDSVANIRYYNMKKKYFDIIKSFDDNDVTKNPEMELLPLFYLDCYKKISSSIEKYDIGFIGSTHSDRAKIINIIRKKLIDNGKTFYFKLYIPSKLLYCINMIKDKDFRELHKNGIVTTEKISSSKINEILSCCNTIIDIQHPKQTGLTMRTIELIGMKKKIITSNVNIINYNFYNENNIFIFDRKKINICLNFFDKKYCQVSDEIYESYSMNSWIDNLFSKE